MPLTLGVLSLSCAWSQQYAISTYAGNGTAGFSGDGGAPTSAQFSGPLGMTFDSSGNLYIVDSVNQRIRKISGGVISTVAGNGTGGYTGDGKAATSAELLSPSAVAVDSSGNLYIADTFNHVIREVATNGNISTIAGNNTGGYAGDGGAATSAELEFPSGIAVDSSGNIYIADSGNNVIREITSGTINTIVGGAATPVHLHDPESVLVDSSGNLYISDQSGFRILKFSGGVVTIIAGNGNIGSSGDNGLAINAELDQPSGIALDAQGYLYICDTDNSKIRKISPSGIITTIAGLGSPGFYGDGGPASGALLYFPRGIVVDKSGNVYISDTGNDRVRELQPQTPSIAAGGVVNAASFTAQISPGALASIFGTNFTGTGVDAIAPLPLPASLGGVSVQVNGVAAPALYASSGQINFQIPWETPTGSVTVAVGINGLTSTTVNVTIEAAAPGLFVQGTHAIVQNLPDFSLNSSTNPAKVGSTITAYLTGAGAVSPTPADGAAAGSDPLSTASGVTATIGGKTATVSFAGLAPNFVGLWQANIVVPAGITQAGDVPLIVSVGGQSSNSANVSVTP